MSLRRKSCDACFKGRRKCDRDYPTCGTCRRTKKGCHYAYAPVSSAGLPDNTRSADTNAAHEFPSDLDLSFIDLVADHYDFLSGQGQRVSDAASSTADNSPASLQRTPGAHSLSSSSLSSSDARPTVPKLNIPNFLGGLGEVQRVEGSTDSWQWVIGELRRCPHDLATRGETLFMHKHLYRDAMPRAIRAALGTSAAFCTLDEDRRQLLFRALDAEVLELLHDPPLMDGGKGWGQPGMGDVSISSGGGSSGLTLIEELARLQALTLYQMMRMFGGGLEQRLVVEQQRGLMTTWALRLLRRSRAELGRGSDGVPGADGRAGCWHSWIVAESIRRTVLVVYMFYGMYSLATEGFCAELPTIAKLPVSAAPASWHSEAAYLAESRKGEAQRTLTYEEFTHCWAVSRPERLDLFDKFLVVPCKGLKGIDF